MEIITPEAEITQSPPKPSGRPRPIFELSSSNSKNVCPTCGLYNKQDCRNGLIMREGGGGYGSVEGCPRYAHKENTMREAQRIQPYLVRTEQYLDKTLRHPPTGVAAAYGKAREWFKNDDNLGALILAGPKGTGKTCLAMAVAQEWQRSGRTAVLAPVSVLLRAIRQSYNEENPEWTEAEIVEALTTVDLLILDDLGKEKTSDHTGQTLFDIIDLRYRVLPTIVTTNLNRDQLVRDDRTEAYMSRLSHEATFVFMGKDLRK